MVPDTPLEAVFTRACKLAEPPKPSPPVEPPKPPPVVETPVQKRGFGKSKARGTPPPPPKPPVAWDYEGKRGARHWGSLDTDYATCGGGEMQSPIDIRNAIRADLPPLRIAYQPVPLSIVDDGHGFIAPPPVAARSRSTGRVRTPGPALPPPGRGDGQWQDRQ